MRRINGIEARCAGTVAAWIMAAIIGCSGCTSGARKLNEVGDDPPTTLAVSRPTSICERYLRCVAGEPGAADHLAEIVAAYGPGAKCWSGDPSVEADCSDACREGALAMPGCGECDEDDACAEGLGCIDHRCAPLGCRVDARRTTALVDAECACSSDCRTDGEFIRQLAHNSAEADCSDAFIAWAACEATELVCRDGRVDLYASCADELEALAVCANRGVSLRCP